MRVYRLAADDGPSFPRSMLEWDHPVRAPFCTCANSRYEDRPCALAPTGPWSGHETKCAGKPAIGAVCVCFGALQSRIGAQRLHAGATSCIVQKDCRTCGGYRIRSLPVAAMAGFLTPPPWADLTSSGRLPCRRTNDTHVCATLMETHWQARTRAWNSATLHARLFEPEDELLPLGPHSLPPRAPYLPAPIRCSLFHLYAFTTQPFAKCAHPTYHGVPWLP